MLASALTPFSGSITGFGLPPPPCANAGMANSVAAMAAIVASKRIELPNRFW